MVKAIKFYCVLFIIGTNFSSCNSNPFKGDNIQSYFDYLFENDINGQIQMFTVEKNDEWKGLFYLLLPLSTRSTIDYKSTNPKVNTIHSYYQAKYNLIDWPSGAIIKYPFESLDFKNPIDFMLGIIHLDSENASQDLKKLHLNELENNINFGSKDNLSTWISLEFLQKKMELFYDFGRNEEAVLCASFARHIIATNKAKLSKYIAEIDYRYLMNTIEDDDFDEFEIFEKSYSILEETDNFPRLLDFISLKISMLDFADSLEFVRLYNEGRKLIKLNMVSPYFEAYFYKSVSRYYSSIGQVKKAMKYIMFSIGLYKSINCSVHKSLGYIYLSVDYIQKENIDSAEYYLNKSLPDISCDIISRMRIEQYYSMISSSINSIKYSIDSEDKYLIKKLSELNTLRSLQEKIFTDKNDLHGLDAFSENCEEQLEVYMQLRNFDTDIPKIIHLFEDSKVKNLKIKKINDAIGYNMTGYRKLDMLNAQLQELNSSVTVKNDYSNPDYKEIYFLNMIKQNSIVQLLRESEFEINKKQVNESINLLKKRNQAHLEIIKTPNKYWYYFLYNNTFKLDTINAFSANELITKIQSNISQNKNLGHSISQIKNLFDINVPKDVRISISSDGAFNQLPMTLIFENDKLYKNLGIVNISEKKLRLNENDFSIFSITDEETNRDMSQVLEFSELLSGYKNCKKVKEKLNIPEVRFVTGKNFTKSKVIDFKPSNAWHISTHAVSTPSSYYDNFIVTRSAEGKQEKMYAYEVLKIENPPKFLALSACNTGIGESKIGAGDFSLSRPFFEIGTNTILSTLWEVNDKSSAEFFDSFYLYWIEEDISVLDAFSKAKSDIRAKYPDPYHWAPFVLEGNPNVYLSKN